MTNLEMLLIGIVEIANNHNFKYSLDWEEDGQVCIYGGNNVPTTCDVRELCRDCKIAHNLETSEFGYDIWIDEDWVDTIGDEEYQGNSMWRAYKDMQD